MIGDDCGNTACDGVVSDKRASLILTIGHGPRPQQVTIDLCSSCLTAASLNDNITFTLTGTQT